MAFTAVITKQPVTINENFAMISALVEIKEDGVVILEQTVSCRYIPGTNADLAVGKLRNKIKDIYDNYVAAQAIYNSSVLDTALGEMKTDLETYMNC